MAKHLKIFLSGVLVVVPFAITIWLIWRVGYWLGWLGVSLGLGPLWNWLGLEEHWAVENLYVLGVVVVVVVIYLIGLMTHFWLFRKTLDLADAIFLRIPGVKTIYQSVRDLTLLFDSGSAARMGKVVECHMPGTGMSMLGILTNEHPAGASEGKVAVMFLFAYMIGGPIVFVPKDQLREVDMSVEQALRLSATAQVTRSTGADAPPGPTRPADRQEK
jgi:uncharacterized membrane protein